MFKILNYPGFGKAAKKALCAAVICIVAAPAHAGDAFLLAYYVEFGKGEDTFVLQQYGQNLSEHSGVSTPVGRGGKGTFSLSLVPVDGDIALLRLAWHEDSSISDSPSYLHDIEFSTEGAKGDFSDQKGDITVTMSYSIVVK